MSLNLRLNNQEADLICFLCSDYQLVITSSVDHMGFDHDITERPHKDVQLVITTYAQ